jgi:hypothetical protein
MIGIVNMKHISGNIYEYEVRINHDVITTFKHDREKGLSGCLEDAAKAVAKKDCADTVRFLKEMEQEYAYIPDKTR